MRPLPRRHRRHPLAAMVAVAATAVLPSGFAQQSRPVETQVWIDISTHHMAGMPGMGALGGLAGRMMGAGKEEMRYPTARHPAMSGQYLDVALHNSLRPGVEAQHAIPGGLKLGKVLPLVPPTLEPTSGDYREGSPTQDIPDVEMTIHEYWGCGAAVRPGQPKTFTMKVRGGNVQSSGSVSQGKFAPDRDIDATPAYAVWPNRKNGRRVPNGALLAGPHRISGNGVPESLQFELGGNAEFMPRIALNTRGQPSDAIALDWQPVDRARAYFINAFAMRNQNTMVLWSSAESGGAGQGLQQYLTGGNIDRWLKEKVLLPPATTSCTIPKGIFAPTGGDPAQGGGMGGMAMLGMIAYGPETHMVWPPRPTDPEELKRWDPEWNLRVRTKSTASAMLGMDLGAGFPSDNGSDASNDGEPRQEEGKGRKLLKGLLRTF